MKDTKRNLFRSSVAALIVGKVPNVRFVSGRDKQRVYENALNASRNLLEVLESEGSSPDMISEAIQLKRSAADVFKKKFGFSWPF